MIQARSAAIPQLDRFVLNRAASWSGLQKPVAQRVALARENGSGWQDFRHHVSQFHSQRGSEVRSRLHDRADGLFTSDWWGGQRWNHHHHGFGDFAYCSPWWWWNSCTWPDAVSFLGADWAQPAYYDYGTSVIDDGREVYVDGQNAGSSADYAQDAAALANAPGSAELPAPPPMAESAPDWQPFGVFALAQERSGDATMFFQLSANRRGEISGAFVNVVVGETKAVTGSIDKATQKAAWRVGDQPNTVFETGVYNLTRDEAPVLLHFSDGTSQPWLLVRLSAPVLPHAPASLNPVAAPPSEAPPASDTSSSP
jgi:hypothetical protein